MSVILGSEVARLVFRYLQEEQLDEAATTFCKTSPYLVEEYDWLQRGLKPFTINDVCLVDIIREYCEIKYAVAEYIESLPLSMGDTLKSSQSLSGKINSIFDLLTNNSKPNSVSRKRPYSMIGSNSTEATQSNELPGYEPPFKERRLSRKLIFKRDSTPKQNLVYTPTSRHETYDSDGQDEENMSPDQLNTPEKSRNETSQYPIFTETILENTQFQNVLVENINRILESSTDRLEMELDSSSHETTFNNNSMQEQVKHAIDSIIDSTAKDPSFHQVLNDVVQHNAHHEQTTRTSTVNDIANNGDEKKDSPVPLKQRLRNRSQDKPRPNYSEIDQSSKKGKRKGKVEVISNEIVSGEIRDLLHPTTTLRTDNYVPLNQILYLNPEKSTTTFGQDLVYVNVSGPSYPQFRIDADTPMFLQDISLANNGTSTSLTPGSIINLPTMEQQIQPIQSLLPNVIVKDIIEVSKTKQIERSIKTTPSVCKNMAQAKARSLSSPRRQPHVRSLFFTTSDDLVNENKKLTNKQSQDDKKLEPEDSGSATNSQTVCNTETSCDDPEKKTSLEEVEQQQDSSDAVDFSKEFDEATVISVELSPAGTTKSECSKEEKSEEGNSEKKKPQTRQQCQKDMEMWNQMRQMKKGEWDNYLRQTVASTTGSTPALKKKIKSRKSKSLPRQPVEANVSTENGVNTTTDIEARLLEEALASAKKPVPPEVTPAINNLPTSESTKKSNDSEQVKPHTSPVVTTRRNTRSPNKRSSGGRKELIQIKLPASAKKKMSMSNKRRSKPIFKRSGNLPMQPRKRAVETSRIDTAQIVDIDLISPIEHPKELNNAVKSGVNLISYLETPCKESSSFKFPITPGFAPASSSIKTPGIRLNKDYDSLIKFPEYPTPSFAITPGRTKTPLSQSSSQKDGSSYNRATDYSSGSSYYKPDESDDIDKNIDVLIKENRTQAMEDGLGVDPQQNIIFCNDEPVSEDGLSDSSSSTSSSSQSSSTSTCSSSTSYSADEADNAEASKEEAKRLFIAQRTQHQLRLEEVRLRTMATLKSDNKIERFRKPTTKISSLQRQKFMDGSSMMKKPMQNSKMTGNSTPKIAPRVLPTHVNKPSANPIRTITTPSKRKTANPRRVICLEVSEPIKSSVRTISHRKPAEHLPKQSNDKAPVVTSKPLQVANPPRPITPTETIDAIENHIAKTCQSSFAECSAKSTTENQIDTPNLLQQLQGKSEVTDEASTPEMGPPANSTKRATLVRELFGDGTMSDSDFMDTPIKVVNIRRSQVNVVPISHAKSEVQMDSITNDSTVEKSVSNSAKSNDRQLTIDSDSIPAVSKSVNSNPNKSKDEDRIAKDVIPRDGIAKDAKTTDSNDDESKAVNSKVTDAEATDSIVKDSIVKDSHPKESNSKESTITDSTVKDSPKCFIPKKLIVKQIEDSHAHNSIKTSTIEKESVDTDPNAKVTIADDSTTEECNEVATQPITNCSQSESDEDDDYDECTLIPALPMSNMSNRIYHNVISETKECAIKLTKESLDSRPMTTFLDGNKIVVTTCDEVILFNSAPKTESPRSTSNESKNKTVTRKNVKVFKRFKKVVDVEQPDQRVQKTSSDGTDNSAPEKNARFNIVAKQKGPIVVSSSQASSSRSQGKMLSPSEYLQQNAGASNEVKKCSEQTKIPPPKLKDIFDINEVLGKIHPSKEVA